MTCMAPQPPPNTPKPAPQGQGSSEGDLPNDPNELTGPGVGAAGFVAAGAVLPYQVTFENEPTATAAVQEVTVTQTLPSDLDWTTFQLGDITFGSNVIAVPAGLQSYSTTVDTTNTDGTALLVDISAGIDLDTGVVTWTFRSVDPSTGQLPAGVDDGFLPPEDGTGRGTASVAYTVQPLASLADGASFTSTASVVFDTNAPVMTNTVTNTLDDVAPTSTVNALPVDSPAQFTVSWSGTDPDNGSGVAEYDVYVSTDGGAYTAFQVGTTATSAEFTGSPGHSYAFYSVATDAVGNAQATPASAQASTTVPPLAVTSISSVSAAGTYGGTATLAAALSAGGAPSAGKTITFTLTAGGSTTTVGTAVTNGSGIATLSSVSLAGINAGSYPGAIGAAFAADSTDTASSNSGTLTVTAAQAQLSLSNLVFGYDGTAHTATVTTSPANLSGVTLTYTQGNVPVAAPTAPGTYVVTATLNNPNFVAASVTSTLTIQAPLPPTPPPTPPAVTGVVGLTKTRKGLTAITVAFDEALSAVSADNTAFYSLFGPVKKHGKTVYTKAVRIKNASSSADTVKLTLAKPYKGAFEVVVRGGIVAANGASSSGTFMEIIK